MNEKLKILIIEDSLDDYELLLRELKKGWHAINAKRIETPEELEESVDEDWDAILSDNTLPRFNALSALKQLRSKNTEVPFIIVSGTIGEELAVEAMRSGANDYILKSDYGRLIPALNRELHEHERKKKQKLTEQKLSISQHRYELLANNIQDLVGLHKPDSTYLWVSPSIEKILGFEHSEVIGQKHFSFIHPDDFDKRAFENPFEGMEHNTILRFNYRLRTKNGNYINVETILQPIYQDDQLSQIVSTTRDVTDQKLAFDLLSESEERYHSVIDAIVEGVLIYSHDGRLIAFNNSAKKIFGKKDFNFQELPHSMWDHWKLIHADQSLFKIEDFPSRITLKTGLPCRDIIIGLVDKEKSEDTIWISANSVVFKEPNGKNGVVITFSDITKQKESEDKITAAASELATLIDTANAPIFGIDWHGRINEWNQVCAKVTGYSKSEVLGKVLINEFILDGYKVAVTDLMKSALRGKNVTNYELPIYTRSGQVVTMLFNATARRDLKGNIIGVLGVGQDITELIQYRDKLEQRVVERTAKLNEALKKEKEVVAMKSKFVSMASHEFRTPLSTISFAADFLKRYHERLSKEEMSKKLDKIDEQVKHMASLLDDVLIMGKSEAGKIVLNTVEININDFCKKLVEEVEHSTKNSHKILLSLATEHSEIVADEKLLRNILINLLSNAIKFSPDHDKVLFDVIYKKNVLTMIVKDWGMGIPEEDQQKVFDAFHRTSNVGTIQGTGLGLAIVKKAVEIHGGSIEIESEVEKGTTFKVTVPVK